MRGATTSEGIIKACVLAGPVFLLAMTSAATTASNAPLRIEPGLALAPLLLLVAVIPGAMLAVVPVLIGTQILTALGRGNVGLRHPGLWALAGATMAAPWLSWPDQATAIALGVTGATCALLARSGVRWHD